MDTTQTSTPAPAQDTSGIGLGAGYTGLLGKAPAAQAQTPAPTDYSKATFNSKFAPQMPQIKQTIQSLRTKGIGDDQIFSYLQQQGVIQMPEAPTAPEAQTSYVDRVGQDYAQAGQDIEGNVSTAASKGMSDLEAGQKSGTLGGLVGGGINAVKDIGEQGLQAAGSLAGATLAPISEAVSPVVQNLVKSSPTLQGAASDLNDWASKHPEASKDLGSIINIATLGAGGAAEGVAKDVVKNAATGAVDTAKGLVNSVKGGAEDVASQTAKTTQANIDAVNPDLAGKKLTAAYKQTVTGSRESTPSNIFKEQGLTPDEQTVNLGTRLASKGIKLGVDHVQNLKTLGDSMSDTESKLTSALQKHPEIDIDKPTLISKLDTAATKMPREFTSIKDSKSVFNNVINFAKQTVNKAKDFEGLRDARTDFDSQAKLEYPSAYKNGTIDLASPAGRAIKTARDMMNEHLYNTAPNGSDIQNLVGHEADIYRATDAVAPKAAATHGQSGLEKFSTKHPKITKVAKATVGLGLSAAGLEGLHKVF